jgi:hypothetical protein
VGNSLTLLNMGCLWCLTVMLRAVIKASLRRDSNPFSELRDGSGLFVAAIQFHRLFGLVPKQNALRHNLRRDSSSRFLRLSRLDKLPQKVKTARLRSLNKKPVERISANNGVTLYKWANL